MMFALTKTGRFVYRFQRWAPYILVLWIFLGRIAVGAGFGYIGFVGVFILGPIMVVLLSTPPIVTRRDTEVRRQRTTRLGYSVTMYLLWGTLFLAGLIVPDENDLEAQPSVLTTWTHGAISIDLSFTLMAVVALISSGLWISAVRLAWLGVERSRAVPSEPAG
jgi:hypothetical protein